MGLDSISPEKAAKAVVSVDVVVQVQDAVGPFLWRKGWRWRRLSVRPVERQVGRLSKSMLWGTVRNGSRRCWWHSRGRW